MTVNGLHGGHRHQRAGQRSDPDGDPLSVTATSSPNRTVTINADGTLNFTPAANFNGDTTITYTVSDARQQRHGDSVMHVTAGQRRAGRGR